MTEEKHIVNKELKKVIIERVKTMPENLKVSLGGEKGFLDKKEIIENIEKETEIGVELYNIHLNHLLFLKKGIILQK